jgi:hypothetical protein
MVKNVLRRCPQFLIPVPSDLQSSTVMRLPVGCNKYTPNRQNAQMLPAVPSIANIFHGDGHPAVRFIFRIGSHKPICTAVLDFRYLPGLSGLAIVFGNSAAAISGI